MSNVFTPANLPCGRTVENRLVKVALYEHLATFFGGPPNHYHFRLYSRWASHGWGMIITGNVQVSNTHLGLGRDVVVPETISEETLQPFRTWASCIHSTAKRKQIYSGDNSTSFIIAPPALAIMQLSHSGRQSPNFLGGRPVFMPPMAPSAIAVGSGAKRKGRGILDGLVHRSLFQTPKSMSIADIEEVVQAFVRGARVAAEAGFDGVQLHAAHGYLLAQFISPKTNQRTDDYSATGDNALRLLRRIVFAIRESVSKDFVLGIKLNSSDFVDGPACEDRALAHVRVIASWDSVDFIEISGGDYENPEFMQRSPSGSPRQALFEKFSHQAVKTLDSSPHQRPRRPRPLILLTGGLRSPAHLCTALGARHADLLGIGRASILCPDFPEILADRLTKHVGGDEYDTQPIAIEPHLKTGDQTKKMLFGMGSWVWIWIWPRIPLVGAGVDISWYTVVMRRWAQAPMSGCDLVGVCGEVAGGGDTGCGAKPDYDMTGVGAILQMWIFVVRNENSPVWRTGWGFLAAVLVSLVVLYFRKCTG